MDNAIPRVRRLEKIVRLRMYIVHARRYFNFSAGLMSLIGYKGRSKEAVVSLV
jgi:hypothetical protein